MNPDASLPRGAAPGTHFDALHASVHRGTCVGSAYLRSARRAASPHANTSGSSTSGPGRMGGKRSPRGRTMHSQRAGICQVSPRSPRGRRQGTRSRECSLREHRITAMSREARAVTRASTTCGSVLLPRQSMKCAPARGTFCICRRPGRPMSSRGHAQVPDQFPV